jgi:hypothetical protein
LHNLYGSTEAAVDVNGVGLSAAIRRASSADRTTHCRNLLRTASSIFRAGLWSNPRRAGENFSSAVLELVAGLPRSTLN